MRIEGDFWRDGAVCVRQAFDADTITLAVEAIEANLASLSPRAKRASTIDDGAFVEDFCNWQRLPELERFIRMSRAAQIAGVLMGATTVRLYHDHMLVKEPGTRQRTPWHQDLPYYNVAGRMNVSMWCPVDPVSRSSTLELIAGTHVGPWYMPRTFLDQQARWFPEGSLAEPPDFDADLARTARVAAGRDSAGRDAASDVIDGDAGDASTWRVLGWELEPGDAVFFHMLTVHGSAGVDGPHRRRVLSVRFLGDDMIHAPRPWVTSPPFPGLTDELAPDAPLDHPLFPVLWTADS